MLSPLDDLPVAIAAGGHKLHREAQRDRVHPLLRAGVLDARVVDRDDRRLEGLAIRLAPRDLAGEIVVDVGGQQAAQRIAVALGEGRDDHLIGLARALDETLAVERGVGGRDGVEPRPGLAPFFGDARPALCVQLDGRRAGAACRPRKKPPCGAEMRSRGGAARRARCGRQARNAASRARRRQAPQKRGLTDRRPAQCSRATLPKAFRLGYHVRAPKSRIKPHPRTGARVQFKLERDAKEWEAVFRAARTLNYSNPSRYLPVHHRAIRGSRQP